MTSAVFGTERRAFTGRNLPEPLRSLPHADVDLLTAASALWAFREAGRIPTPGPPGMFQGPPADDRPCVPAGALRALNAILEDFRYRTILPEWLALANRIGGRLPPEMVPAILDAGQDADPRAVRQLAGPLGAWLSEQNPDWAGIASGLADPGRKGWTPDAVAATWEGGDHDRVAIFAAFRAARPAEAREFLQQVWTEEPPSTRAALVGTFDTGLSLDDEPFLDHLLRDRRKDVRAAAVSLLSKLPGSHLMADSEAKTLPQVRIRGRRRPTLQVEPDAVEESIASTRLAAWPEHLKRDPVTLIEMAQRSGASGLIQGWAAAAVRQRDATWAEALLEGGAPPSRELLGILPSSAADRVTMSLLKEQGLARTTRALLNRPTPWSAALTNAVTAALAATIATGDVAGNAGLRDALPAFGLAFDPRGLAASSSLPDALERVPEASRPAARTFWTRRIGDLLAVLHFRHAMYREFR